MQIKKSRPVQFRLIRIAAAAAAVFLCRPGFAEDTITLWAIDSPPYYVANPEPGEKPGVAIELAVDAWKAVDTDVELSFIPMARAAWSLSEHRDSALLGTPQWFAVENREHLIDSVDLLSIRFVFFYKKDRFPEGLEYRTLENLKEYVIGNVWGSSTITILEEAALNLELVGQVEQNFRKLDAGRVDLVVGVDLTGWTLLGEIYPDSVNEFAATKPFYTADISVIFLKEEENLIRKFKSGLNTILRDGTYQQVVRRYYGDDQDLAEIVPTSLLSSLE